MSTESVNQSDSQIWVNLSKSNSSHVKSRLFSSRVMVRVSVSFSVDGYEFACTMSVVATFSRFAGDELTM